MNDSPENPNEPAQHTIAALAPGKLVGGGRYLLKKVLGQGGMGVVWLAHDMRLRELTALKFLPPEIAADAAAVEDLRRETLRSRKLSHANIVRIHDLCETKGELTFISMEYVDGPNLHDLRAKRPSQVLAWTFLMPLVRQLCEALDYAHGERVLHRDLKPANMMLDGNGRLKLADFGLACVLHDSSTRSSGRSHTRGTLSYMSPQQADGDKPAITDDIYSLGATLYDLLTSQPPFYTGDIGYQLRHNRPQYMRERLADLELTNEFPSEVSAMVMACLAKEPEKRPPNARAILDWLESNILEETERTESGKGSTTRSSKPAPLFVPPPIEQRRPAEAGTTSGTGGPAEAGTTNLRPPEGATTNDAKPAVLVELRAPGRQQIPAPVAAAVTAPAEGSAGNTGAAEAALAADQESSDPSQSTRPAKPLFWALGTVVVAFVLALGYYLHQTKRGHSGSRPGAGLSEEGFERLFNGADLSGWKGDPRFWSVKDGAIAGQYSPETGLQHGTFLIWEGGNLDDFEVRLSFRGQGSAGVKYRSRSDTQGNLTGYMAPLWQKRTGALVYTGRYQSVRELAGGNASLRPPGEWNEYVITARNRRFKHQINGITVAEASDEDKAKFIRSGILALELYAGTKEPPYTVYFKDIRLKRMDAPPSNPAPPSGFTNLFNGRDLAGWTGDVNIWSAKNGVIAARPDSSTMRPRKSTFLVWDGVVDDFEFTCKFRMRGLGIRTGDGSSGVEYRSKKSGAYILKGYQAEIGAAATGQWIDDTSDRTDGVRRSRYAEKLAYLPEGRSLNPSPDGMALPGSIRSSVREDDWNELTIVAQGGHMVHKINGFVAADVTDDDRVRSLRSGLLGLELYYRRGNVALEFKDLFLKRLK